MQEYAIVNINFKNAVCKNTLKNMLNPIGIKMKTAVFSNPYTEH